MWLKHSVLSPFYQLFVRRAAEGRREPIFVDASFTNEGEADAGSCGVGVWLPRRKVAIALNLKANTSMEAETLALLAGALAAKRFGIQRPLIFSDCKSAVGTAKRLLHVHRSKGILRKLDRLVTMSASHQIHRHIYDALKGMGGSLEWRRREENREADIASCIGNRIGHMGIRLGGRKDRAHALNDVLSLAGTSQGETDTDGTVRQRLRCGTETVEIMAVGAPPPKVHRQVRGLIDRLMAEVA